MRLEKYSIDKDDILLTEGIEDVGIFKAVFMAGTAGAGKTYVARKVTSGLVEPRVVNTDTWVEYFNNDWNNFYDLTKKLVKSQLALFINSMLPILGDQTSTSMNTVIRRQHIMERMGYDVAMIYVNTSLETAIERVSKRDRKVPVKDIKDYYDRANKLKPYLKAKFDIFLEVKNDEGELTDDVILKAFKRMLFFYTAPVVNPLGQDAIKMMRENHWKYLSPEIYTLDEIKTTEVGRWYSSE